LRRAIELDANNPFAVAYLALNLSQKGQTEESVRIARELAAANPVAIDFRRIYALLLFHARKYDEAIAECERILELDPNHLPTYGTYASVLVEKARFQEAEVAFNKAKMMNPGVQAWLYARQNNMPAAARSSKRMRPCQSIPVLRSRIISWANRNWD
jgi:tetratricopeptide (TPR) repeat protein